MNQVRNQSREPTKQCSMLMNTDAADFSKLILEKPNEGSPRLDIGLLDGMLLTVSRYKWEYAKRGGEGSYVVFLGQSSDSTKPSRIEPLFVPHKFDFVLPLGNDPRYSKLSSRFFWVPWYKSDKEEEYEEPDPAVCASVELVQLPKEYLICFEEAAETSNGSARENGENEVFSHLETMNYCNNDLQRFLNILTGWNVVVVFSAIDVRPKRRGLSVNRGPSLADVLCFRKAQETRVAIRRKDPDEEKTIEWISATLVENVDVKTRIQKIYMKLKFRQTGQNLTLATVTVADVKTKAGLEKTETWVVTVAKDSGELFRIINVSFTQIVQQTHIQSSAAS